VQLGCLWFGCPGFHEGSQLGHDHRQFRQFLVWFLHRDLGKRQATVTLLVGTTMAGRRDLAAESARACSVMSLTAASHHADGEPYRADPETAPALDLLDRLPAGQLIAAGRRIRILIPRRGGCTCCATPGCSAP
jgi:hypothetical protein